MQALKCEMCGGNDLLKDNGLFVCQHCGMKYTLEEARKLMIEGVVEVKGTVAVDKSGELENLLVLAERALKEGNYESAQKYYDDILRSDPDNWKANFYKSYCTTMVSKIINLDSAFSTTISTATSSIEIIRKQEPIDTAAIEEIMEKISSLANLVVLNKFKIYTKFPEKLVVNGTYVNLQNKLGFSKVINELKAVLRNVMLVESAILSADYATSKMVSIAEKTQKEMQEAAVIFAKQNPYPNNAIWRSSFEGAVAQCRELDKILEASKELIEKGKVKIKEREESVQKQRNDEYWTEHAEEKKQLEEEFENLKNECEQLKGQAEPFDNEIKEWKAKREADTPSMAEKKKLEEQIAAIRQEQKSLGLFKGKEKKALQERIDALSAGFSAINDKIEAEEKEQIKLCNNKIKEIEQNIKPIKDKITELQKRIGEINSELTKNR